MFAFFSELIDKVFPTSQVTVDALSNKVVLSGYVSDSEQVAPITELAQDYFPQGVIGNLRVAKSPNVAIQVKIYEVSRTKLRRLGVDWSFLGPNFARYIIFLGHHSRLQRRRYDYNSRSKAFQVVSLEMAGHSEPSSTLLSSTTWRSC